MKRLPLVVSPQVMKLIMAASLATSLVMGCATMPRSMVGALINQAPIPETEESLENRAKDSPGVLALIGRDNASTSDQNNSLTDHTEGVQAAFQNEDTAASVTEGISNNGVTAAEGGADQSEAESLTSISTSSSASDEKSSPAISVDNGKGAVDQVSKNGATASPVSTSDQPDPLAIKTPREPWNASYEVYGDAYDVMDSSLGYLEVGIASWYGKKFHGRKTSNGERFDMYQVSAAHKTLPIPTVVRVTNLENSKKIDVRINDRGPFHDDRLIDLSMAAARALGFSEQGTAPVVVEAIDAVNYPEQVVLDETPASVYLQAGAFQSVVAARTLMNKIEAALPETLAEVGLRELPSEQTGGILHKVWIGPLTSPERTSEVTELLASLGVKKPMRVKLD